MLKIDELYAFIAIDNEGEGLTGMQVGNMMMPMVAANKERVDSLRQTAQHISNSTGREIKLIKFSLREELEVIKPNE